MANNLQTMASVAVAGSEDPRTPPLLHPHHDPHTCDMPLTGSHLGMAPGTPTAGSMVAALTVILAQAAMCADGMVPLRGMACGGRGGGAAAVGCVDLHSLPLQPWPWSVDCFPCGSSSVFERKFNVFRSRDMSFAPAGCTNTRENDKKIVVSNTHKIRYHLGFTEVFRPLL